MPEVLINRSKTKTQWLEKYLPVSEFERIQGLPQDVIDGLYENVYKFGPNGDATMAFYNDVLQIIAYNGEEVVAYHLKQLHMVNPIQRISGYSIGGPNSTYDAIDTLKERIRQEAPLLAGDAGHTIHLIAYQGLCVRDPNCYRWLDEHAILFTQSIEAFLLNPSDYEYRDAC